jgi:hypothetical protein
MHSVSWRTAKEKKGVMKQLDIQSRKAPTGDDVSDGGFMVHAKIKKQQQQPLPGALQQHQLDSPGMQKMWMCCLG